MALCSKCKVEKPKSDFYPQPRMRQKVQSYCKDCNKQASATWLKSKPLEYRSSLYRRKNLKRDFGITVEMYDALFLAQKGLCSICGCPEQRGKNLAVDHSHETKKVRGLLCCLCNTALERLETDPEWGMKAINYLSAPVLESLLMKARE